MEQPDSKARLRNAYELQSKGLANSDEVREASREFIEREEASLRRLLLRSNPVGQTQEDPGADVTYIGPRKLTRRNP